MGVYCSYGSHNIGKLATLCCYHYYAYVCITQINSFFLTVSLYKIYKVRRYGQKMTGAQHSNFELARYVMLRYNYRYSYCSV